MIIISSFDLEVGKVYGPEHHNGVISHYGVKTKEFRFKVIRRASKEEYIEFITSDSGKVPTYFPFDNFFEIHAD